MTARGRIGRPPARGVTASKSFTVKATPEEYARIAAAADAVGVALSPFVLFAALKEADRVATSGRGGKVRR